jgi:hypothetical protein
MEHLLAVKNIEFERCFQHWQDQLNKCLAAIHTFCSQGDPLLPSMA